MTDRPDIVPHPVEKPDLAEPDPTLDIVRQVMAEAEHMAVPDMQEDRPPRDPVETAPAPVPHRGWRLVAPFTRRRSGGRTGPHWGRIGLVWLGLAIVVSPWAVLIAAGLGLVLPVIAYLTLGHDRTVELLVAAHDRLARRNPAKAAGLRRKWRRMRGRAARVAAWLPGDLGARLMPEPVPEEMRERMAADPFGRLNPEPGPR